MGDLVNKDKFIQKLWKTKGARFLAYARLKQKHHWSVFSISMLSLYIVAFSILLLGIDGLKFTITAEALSFLTIIASIFALLLTHLENSKNYLVRAEHMHNCALEILAIYNELQAELELYIEQKKNSVEIYALKQPFIKKYNEILLKYPENHDPIDYKLFIAENYKEFPSLVYMPILRYWYFVWYKLTDSFIYIVCTLLPLWIFYALIEVRPPQ